MSRLVDCGEHERRLALRGGLESDGDGGIGRSGLGLGLWLGRIFLVEVTREGRGAQRSRQFLRRPLVGRAPPPARRTMKTMTTMKTMKTFP